MFTPSISHALFDAAAWFSGLGAGVAVYRWRLVATVKQTAAHVSFGYFASLALGGILGAFALGTLNVYLSGQHGIGRSILGALFGSIVAVEFYKSRKKIRQSTGGVFVVPFCVGVIIGRFGCLYSGLEDYTYGIPTFFTWGWDFGDGILRHPVQLYEAFSMAAFMVAYVWLLAKKSTLAINHGFYFCTGWYSLQRFAWEFFKPYAMVLGPFNLFHLICLILVLYSLAMLGMKKREKT